MLNLIKVFLDHCYHRAIAVCLIRAQHDPYYPRISHQVQRSLDQIPFAVSSPPQLYTTLLNI